MAKEEKLCPIMSKPVGEGESYSLFEVECRKDCALLVKGVVANQKYTEVGPFCGLIQEG